MNNASTARLSLAAKLMWRNWRSGELRILSSAVVLAVAVVSAIAIFADRMEGSISRQSNAYLAADRQVVGRFIVPEQWRTDAQPFNLRQSSMVEFASMVFTGEEMTLASIKAVAEGYPLRGQLEISEQPFPPPEAVTITQSIPAPGEVWVDSSLLPMLDIKLGDGLTVGDSDFMVARVLVHEPDGGQGFAMAGPRVMMNHSDLAATNVVQPGSRITYRWLLAGEPAQLDDFEQWLKPKLGEHYRLVSLEQSQRNISQALDRGKSFLMLAGIVGVLLAGVAVAMAAQQFARTQQDTVALLKSLGRSTADIRVLYFGQLFFLGVIATGVGLLFGYFLQGGIALSVSGLFQTQLIASSGQPYIVGAATGLLCLLCFALPPLWHLPNLSPVRIFRSSVQLQATSLLVQGLIGLLAIVLIIGFYSGDIKLTFIAVFGILAIVGMTFILATLLLRGTRQIGSKAGSIWRLAVSNLTRNARHSITQLVVFATAFMLLLVMFLVRTSLIEDWRLRLPENAPNHFFLNIASYEAEPIEQRFTDKGYTLSPMYPMVLARLIARNDQPFTEQERAGSNSLRRELNLSWAETLPEDNKILEGAWWDNSQSDANQAQAGVSVEEDTAKQLGLVVGDQLTFSVGGLSFNASVASIRSVDWNALTPNFFFLFSPGALESYATSYLTSGYVPPADSTFVADLIRSYPTVSVLEVDRIVDRIKSIVDQVGRGVELVLAVVILGGVLVLVATVNASMAARLHETSLIRALGCKRGVIIGSLWLEFAILGFCSGFMAVASCELLIFALRTWVFEQPNIWHPWLWLFWPVAGAVIIGCLGAFACRRVVTVPPGLALRELSS